MSQLQSLRKQVLQLRQEANVNRIPVSQACEECWRVVVVQIHYEPGTWNGSGAVLGEQFQCFHVAKIKRGTVQKYGNLEEILHSGKPCYLLMKFCNEHQKSDVLVYGISQSENPFKENKGCVLL